MAEAQNDVFMSYRRIDIEFAKRLVQRLEIQGKSVWVDWNDIPPGAVSFSQEIRRGIENVHTFIAVLSSDYLVSPYCLAELEHAALMNKRIIPIVFQKFDGFAVPRSIEEINWIYFVPHSGQENDFMTASRKVLDAIDADYAHIQEHTRLLGLANDWKSSHRNSGFLLRSDALIEAEHWLEEASSKDPKPTSLHTEFIISSRRAQSQQQRRLLLGTAILLSIALIALIVAVQQFFVATRRADETLSLLIANDARDALNAGDPITAISRAYYASTFIDNPPDTAVSILQAVAFQPAPRYTVSDAISDRLLLPQLAEVGSQIPLTDTLYIMQDTPTTLSIRNASDDVQNIYRNFTSESRDDSLIHPDVIDNIQQVQNNHFGPRSIGYDLSPDGDLVAIGGERGLMVWQNTDGAPLMNTFTDHTLIVDNVKFSDDGRFLISSASERQLVNFGRSEVEYFIRDVATGQVIQNLTLVDNALELVAIEDNAQSLIFFDYDTNGLSIWDTSDGSNLWQTRLIDFIKDLQFTNDATQLIVSSVLTERMAPPDTLQLLSSSDGTIQNTWDGIGSNRIERLPILLDEANNILRLIDRDAQIVTLDFNTDEENIIDQIEGFTFMNGISPNGRFIAYEDFEASDLVIVDLDTVTMSGRVPTIGFLRAVSISPDGQYLAYTTQDPDTDDTQLIVYDVSTTEQVATFDNVYPSFAVYAHLFTSQRHFIYQDTSNIIHMVDTQTWQATQLLTGFLEEVNDMEYSADSQRLIVAGVDGALRLWDTTTGNSIFQLNNIGNFAHVALSQDGTLIATGNEAGQLSAWQIYNAQETLTWVEQNRAIAPLSCADRTRYRLKPCTQ